MKRRLKKKNVLIFGIIVLILLIEFINPWKLILKSRLSSLGYSSISCDLIISYGLKDELLDFKYSDFIDKNIIDKNFNKEYINYYKEILYNEKASDLELINELINVGYNVESLNYIIKTGTNDSIKTFLEKDKYDDNIISRFLQFDFSSLSNLDKYIEYKELNVCKDENAVLYVNLGLDREIYVDYDEVNEFNVMMLVNKNNKLSNSFVPDDLIHFDKKYCNGECLQGNKEMVDAFGKMARALYDEEKLNIYVNGAYRSYDEQKKVYDKYLKLYGQSYVDKNIALPGFSEHQTGLCVDIKAGSSNTYAGSKESVWLKNNAYKYGFILRFEKNKMDITGFKEEPWHYRYVGVDASTYIKNNKISFEEYYVKFLYNIEK